MNKIINALNYNKYKKINLIYGGIKKMAKNSNLHNAKVAKNDDFFTQLSDI